MAASLYICYFGLREPLVQTQVLPYLRQLRNVTAGNGDVLADLSVKLLTFEPDLGKNWSDDELESERRQLADEGIEWHFTGYHRWPSVPATAFDVLNGIRIVAKLLRNERIDVLHGRVLLPTLMAAVARRLSRQKPKLLFDIRGFFPEEYTDAGIWPKNGLLYRAAKRVEAWLMKESDGYVVLTEKARDILFSSGSGEGGPTRTRSNINGKPFEVIPCCVDLQRFKSAESRESVRERLGIKDRFVVCYVGSFGGWYMTDEMTDFLDACRHERPETFALILTQRDREKVVQRLRQRGFEEGDFLVESVKPSEIVNFLAAGDVAVSFIKSCYSKRSSSPTKIAEYLACSLPIVTNEGVGDTTEQITSDLTGVIVRRFDRNSYDEALREIDLLLADRVGLATRCRESAERRFDLEKVGGERYRRLYRKLLHE